MFGGIVGLYLSKKLSSNEFEKKVIRYLIDLMLLTGYIFFSIYFVGNLWLYAS